MTKLNCAELTEKANEQAATIDKLTADIKQLQDDKLPTANLEELVRAVRRELITELDGKIQAIKDDCVEKMNRLRSDINIKIEADATATLRAVTGFFKTLDDKIKGNTLNIDVLEDHYAKQKTAVEQINADLQSWSKPHVSRSATKTETLRHAAAISENKDYLDSSKKNVTLASLEARIDKLEDFSRRDNLLFTGIEENSNEQCENTVRDILARKILNGVCNVNDIAIVRAHRLGRFKSGQTRPIIVKFREFADKQLILQQVFKGKLINTGLWATEDFSVNTTEDRKYLRTHLNAAKDVLAGKIKNSSVRYKAIHITNTKGKRFVFPLHKVVSNSQGWWKIVGEEANDIYFDTESDINLVTDVEGPSTQSSDGGIPPTESLTPPEDITASPEQQIVVPEPVVSEEQAVASEPVEGEEEG